jgi:hypothetical protein
MDLKGLISSRFGLHTTFYRPIAIPVVTFGILTTSLSVLMLAQISSSFASQSNEQITDGGAADDKASQRWIPIDRRKLGELGRLGELLQSPPVAAEETESTNPSEANSSRSKGSLPLDLSKLDLRSLEERLASLSPAQKERLKKLASELSKNETVKDLSTAFRDLPPALLEQVRESAALREFAQDVLEDAGVDEAAKDSDFLSLDDSNNQPWIKFDPANSSLRTEKETQDNKGNIDDPTMKSGTEPGATKDNRNQLESNGNATAERSGAPNRYRDSEDSRPGERAGGARNAEQRVRNGNQRSNDLRSGSAGQRNSNSSPSTKQASATPSGKTATSNPSQTPESAFDVFKQRLGELGFGQTFEKLAKEAIGIEKSRDGRIGNEKSLSEVNKDASRSKADKDRTVRKEQAARQKESELVNRESAAASNRDKSIPGQKETNEQATAQNRASTTESSTSKPEQQASLRASADAPKEELFSSWRAPTWNDLPSFSIWHLVGLAALVGLIAGLFLIKRTPELMKSVAQRRKEEVERARLIEMEIANREQVVLAFDTFVARQLRSFEDWWTSQRVIKHVSDLKMTFSSQLKAAEQVYKQARYSPPDQELSEKELATVREAIRECAKSRDAE